MQYIPPVFNKTEVSHVVKIANRFLGDHWEVRWPLEGSLRFNDTCIFRTFTMYLGQKDQKGVALDVTVSLVIGDQHCQLSIGDKSFFSDSIFHVTDYLDSEEQGRWNWAMTQDWVQKMFLLSIGVPHDHSD